MVDQLWRETDENMLNSLLDNDDSFKEVMFNPPQCFVLEGWMPQASQSDTDVRDEGKDNVTMDTECVNRNETLNSRI